MTDAGLGTIEIMKHERLICWGIGIGSPLALYALVRLLPSLLTASDDGVILREIVLIVASASWLALLTRNSPLSAKTIGLTRPKIGDLGWGVIAALAILVTSVSAALMFQHLGVQIDGSTVIGSLAARPSWLIFLIALTAAISEEVVFRAICIPAIEKASNSKLVAVIVSTIVFAIPHMTAYGVEKVLITLVPGLAFASLFVWRRSLAVCVIAHFLVDVVALAGLIFRTDA